MLSLSHTLDIHLRPYKVSDAVPGNVASHRVAAKSGAVREGTLKRRLILNGDAHDATMFSFTREMKSWR
jgi:RimJ/RimL family protein N-acetyltransferase